MMDYNAIPDETLAALHRYVRHRIPTGSFLRAVLENDLKGAIGRADPHNLAALASIVGYIYNEVPGACQGSPEIVRAWLDARTDELVPLGPGLDPDAPTAFSEDTWHG